MERRSISRRARDVVQEMKSLGTEQNRKIYRRHGVLEDQYGVSFTNLRALAKRIRADHDLAEELWSTGNHDARLLATMVADPVQATGQLLEDWANALADYVEADAFADFVSKTAFAREKVDEWRESEEEWIGRAGWKVLAHLALRDGNLSDGVLEGYLEIIEREIHARKNRVREAMNSALIAIGVRNARLERRALAAARKIGKVEVDHGETECKTPDATEYIRRTRERAKGRGVRRRRS